MGGEGQLNIEDVCNQVMPIVKGGDGTKRMGDSDSFCRFVESPVYGHLFSVMGKMKFVSRGLILSHLGRLRPRLKKIKQLNFKKPPVIISRCLNSELKSIEKFCQTQLLV